MSKISEQRRQQILIAACTAFAEKGVESVSMAEIAQGAEIGKSTIYEYFASKSELFTEVVLWVLQNLTERVHLVFQEDISLREQLCRYLEIMVGNVHGDQAPGNILRFLNSFETQSLCQDMQQFGRTLLLEVTGGVRRAVDRGELPGTTDAETTAALLCSLLMPLPIANMRKSGMENAVERAVDTVLYGLCRLRKSGMTEVMPLFL